MFEYLFVLILFVHWLADFVFQSEWMSNNKYKNWDALGAHVATYTIIMTAFGLNFAILNGFSHFAIDAVTSRITHRLYSNNKIHWFFVVIGFDQFLHLSILYLTMGWFR